MVLLFVAFQTGHLANGGVESFLQLAERFSEVRRIVVTDRHSPATARLEKAGCEIHVLAPSPARHLVRGLERTLVAGFRKLPRLSGMNAEVYRLVRESGAQVVHCNDISAFWHAAVGARAAGARVLFNVRSIFAPERRYNLRWRLARHLADVVVTLSEEMKRDIESRIRPLLPLTAPYAHLARTEVLRSIVDLDRLRPPSRDERVELRRDLDLADGDVMIAFIAAVWEVKQQLPFLQHAAPLLLEDPRIRIEVVGDFDPESEYGAECLRAVAALPETSRGRVRIHGYVADPERFYGAADLTVLASRYEGLARAMIESLACGVPMVSVDVSSAREILEAEDTGVVVPRGDWPRLASSLAELARAPERRRAMGARGRRLAETLFEATTQVEKHRALYRGLVEHPHEETRAP